MAAAIGKYAANKVLRSEMKKFQHKEVAGDTDPYFTMIEDPRKPGRMKKVKKQVPAYIPEHDAEVLAKMRSRAYKLDCSLGTVFGTRFGWSSVIGIFPAFGDAIDGLLALLLVWRCTTIDNGLPADVLLHMLINVAIDFVIGLVPFLGDIADGFFKANTKNVRVLEKHLDKKYKPTELKQKTRGSRMYEDNPATAFEDFSDEENERRQFIRETDGAADVRRPERTAERNDRRSGGGWFGLGRGNKRERDVERGERSAARPARLDEQEHGTVYNERR
ncbi:hypothetical protein MBLNU459_g0424t1 [Dothideomycetes sp. NU459]